MNCVNFPKINFKNHETARDKLDYHIQRITQLQLLLDQEEKLVFKYLKSAKQTESKLPGTNV